MAIDLEGWLEKVKACDVLAEDELKVLCEYVRYSAHSLKRYVLNAT